MPRQPTSFAELLRARRRALSLTQAQLAERAQLSERAISDVERHLKTPHPATVRLLARALDLSPDELEEWQAARSGALARGGISQPYGVLPARTSFVGRVRLLSDVCRLLDPPQVRTRLLTLTGAGGTGKTRLALEAGRVMRDQYADGVCFIGLAAIFDPRLVARSIAEAFGVAQDGRLPPLEGLNRYLNDRHLLLILDNFEQVLGAAVDIAELLAVCPRVQLLVTSRAPLRVQAEQELAVPPLELPGPSAPDLDELGEFESVRLFVERARAVDPEFKLTPHNVSAVAEICRRVDGLPLAIELAAARIRLLDPPAMLPLLERRMQLLTSGARDAPVRQQTLRNTIAWSYDLLEQQERAVFRRLAVFVGGISLDAARAVCAEVFDSDDDEVLDTVESLLARSLLRRTPAASGEVRLGMLETIREFGLEQLAWSGELEGVRRGHAEYFLDLAERAAPGLMGPQARGWLDRLELEHDNLRAALTWSLESPANDGELALRLTGLLGRFWWLRGHFGEGRRWLDQALAMTSGAPSARMRALHCAGWLAHFQHESKTARGLLTQSLDIAERQQDAWWQAWALHALGRVAYFDYDAVAARRFAERSLHIAQVVGDPWLSAWAIHLLGLAAYLVGDDATAVGCYDQSLTIRRELGHLDGIAITLDIKGILAQRAGNKPAALELYRESLRTARELTSSWLLSTILPHFATLAAEHQPARAARLGGAVALMSESAQTLPIPLTQALFDEGMQLARSKLGETSFSARWTEGRAMSLDAAIDEALSVELPHRSEAPLRLTPMEVQVLRRMASGLTTREIAAELVVAISTVDRHITHIYQKIGRRGRAAAVAFALESDLLTSGTPSADPPSGNSRKPGIDTVVCPS